MLNFLHDLILHGRVVVPLAVDAGADDPSELESAIRELDAQAREELAHSPPELHLPTALWALALIESACRFLVYREFDEQHITAAMQVAPPAAPAAQGIYSADLFLRYLPDITRMARGVGESDPLVGHLQTAARRWPLSSVGMPDITCITEALDPILAHESLRQLYVDRIIERADAGRLQPPAVRAAVRVALGSYPSLAAEISKAMDGMERQA